MADSLGSRHLPAFISLHLPPSTSSDSAEFPHGIYYTRLKCNRNLWFCAFFTFLAENWCFSCHVHHSITRTVGQMFLQLQNRHCPPLNYNQHQPTDGVGWHMLLSFAALIFAPGRWPEMQRWHSTLTFLTDGCEKGCLSINMCIFVNSNCWWLNTYKL